VQVCVIGILNHVDQAKALKLDASNLDEVNKFAKEAKQVKKWARKYDVLLVSESLKLKFTKAVGKLVNVVGRQPVFINDSETIESKMQELQKTIRFRIKKGPWLATAIGLEEQTPEELRQNLLRSVNFLISLLPKGWQNIGSMTIKTTMGKPVKLF
jgi:large subunit ribosomal protein L10Ae